MPAWPSPSLHAYQLTLIRFLLYPAHPWERNPRHHLSSVCAQGFLKPQGDHVTCWRRPFRGMRESRMLAGGAGPPPPPICTAHLDSFYLSTSRQTLHGTLFSSVTRYRCFPLDFASFTPSSRAVFCLKLSLNPHTGLIRPGSGLRWQGDTCLQRVFVRRGILPPVR